MKTTSKPTLLVASTNRGKIREFGVLLNDSPLGATTIGRDAWPAELDEVVEDRETFHGNALKKALELSRATDATTIADDSGLVIDALGGRPGVHSARFAGPDASDSDNNQKMLEELEGVAPEHRSARYTAAIALVISEDALGRDLRQRLSERFDVATWTQDFESIPKRTPVEFNDRLVVWTEASCEGVLIDQARGEAGFGYDPYFLIPAWNKTLAEVSIEKKNEISHRAAALNELIGLLCEAD